MIRRELEKAGDERTERETEILVEYLEDEENKKKKAKTEEATGRSCQAARAAAG